MKTRGQSLIRALAACLLLAGIVGVAPLPAVHAADQVVTNTDDSGAGSLRQAIADASPGDTITFDLPSHPATIHLTGGQLEISMNLDIAGPGADNLTINAGEKSRVFMITGGSMVTISGVTIARGLATGDPAEGGGVRNEGTLKLRQAVVSASRALGDEGADAYGGGIWNSGTLVVQGSTIRDNTAESGDATGSFIYGTGGGIFNTGTLSIQGSRLSDNTALGGDTLGGGNFVGGGRGGGIAAAIGGTTHVGDSTLRDNTAEGGTGATSGGGAYGGGIHSMQPLTVTTSILTGNVAKGGTGRGNLGGEARGGGISAQYDLTLQDSTLDDNTALGGDGPTSGGLARGGGMAVGDEATVEGSTLSNNTAQGGRSTGGKGGDAGGGGAYIATLVSVKTTFLNSTVSHNQASPGTGTNPGEGRGGGIYIPYETIVHISFCTIAGNHADDYGGGLHSWQSINDNEGPILRNTIIGNNTVPPDGPQGPDIFRRVQSRGWNLVETTTDGLLDEDGPDNIPTGNITGQDPRLGPLQDNGGPTWTHALLDSADPSPAINNGSGTDIDGNTISTDQRGFSRPWPPLLGTNDIGAYERGFANLAITKTVTPDQALPGQAITYTLAFTNTGYEIAADVLITDRVPVSVTVTGVVSTGVAITDTGASPPYVWAVQDLIPGHGGTIILSGVLATGLPGGHTFGNTAIIGTSAPEPVTDNNQSTAELTVLNAAPVAVNDSYQTNADSLLTVAAPGVLANDTDANGGPLTAVRDTDPLSGTLALSADGSFVYTPAAGTEGVVTFTYHANDGTADSNVATVTITVGRHKVYLPLVLRN